MLRRSLLSWLYIVEKASALRVSAACAKVGRFQVAKSISKYYVTTKRTKDTKVGNYYISIFYFVLFATFVVKCLFRFCLRICRARVLLHGYGTLTPQR